MATSAKTDADVKLEWKIKVSNGEKKTKDFDELEPFVFWLGKKEGSPLASEIILQNDAKEDVSKASSCTVEAGKSEKRTFAFESRRGDKSVTVETTIDATVGLKDGNTNMYLKVSQNIGGALFVGRDDFFSIPDNTAKTSYAKPVRNRDDKRAAAFDVSRI